MIIYVPKNAKWRIRKIADVWGISLIGVLLLSLLANVFLGYKIIHFRLYKQSVEQKLTQIQSELDSLHLYRKQINELVWHGIGGDIDIPTVARTCHPDSISIEGN